MLEAPGARIAFTTDSYVVSPLVFPGGDIGSVALCGTVNDLAVCGARPLALSLSFIIEEGFEIKALEGIVRSIAAAAQEASSGATVRGPHRAHTPNGWCSSHARATWLAEQPRGAASACASARRRKFTSVP